LARGDDPLAVKRAAKAAKASEGANTFSIVATELAEKKRQDGKAAATLRKFDWFMTFAFPALGARPVHEISAREVLAVLKEVEARGTHETARRLRAGIGDVFRFTIATARAENDPTVALRGALVAPTVKPRAAIVAPKAFGGLLRAIENYDGAAETRYALELLALTFVRPGELRAAEWAEFDLDAAVWEIPAARMKMRKPHCIPLSGRAVAILLELRKLTGRGRFVFPSTRSTMRCMSPSALSLVDPAYFLATRPPTNSRRRHFLALRSRPRRFGVPPLVFCGEASLERNFIANGSNAASSISSAR
jgi:integrase